MVTGVETDGLVLSLIPIILEGLTFYMRGIETTKRSFRYHEQLRSLIRELSAENAVYANTLNKLLVGTQRLGTSYESYIATMDDLLQTVDKLKRRLKLDSAGNLTLTDSYAFKDCYKGLKLSLRKANYNDLVATLRRSNDSLHRITNQTMTFQSLRMSSVTSNHAVPNFNLINDRAQGFHSAIRAGWQCTCHSNHSVNLRLEPRIDRDEIWTTLTLRTVLQDGTFPLQTRLQLSVTLACSVLQLHETPWLNDDWTKDDILFIKRSDNIVYSHPFVTQRLASPERPATTDSTMRMAIRNQTLYGLGVSLIKLWYGSSIADLKKPDDSKIITIIESTTTITELTPSAAEFRTAGRLLNELYSNAGVKYANAVGRCIWCDFDHCTTSLDNTGFQRAVFRGVVAELKENFDFLHPTILT
ncbi:hypothetical protein P280DRAFT_543896 [Massarina eburnea CBS 473.64]|uniref:DUF7580 domain-containing protein n=1 Tax=Massarina eburnea CBS 473.64 TaxID=1395130 RepID=A0A6A6RZG9_9PLEO|nr:hypothetical protein P280DRAFT_543896 [Massarina eburnea CBS 473.64]